PVAVMKRAFGPEATRTIVNSPIRKRRAHIGKPVRERKTCSGHADGKRLVRVEGIEPDTGPPAQVPHVRSKIQFKKTRNTRNGRKTGWAYTTHKKRYDANPCFTVESVYFQSLRQCRL